MKRLKRKTNKQLKSHPKVSLRNIEDHFTGYFLSVSKYVHVYVNPSKNLRAYIHHLSPINENHKQLIQDDKVINNINTKKDKMHFKTINHDYSSVSQ